MNKRIAVLTVVTVILMAALGLSASAQDTKWAVGQGVLTAQGDGSILLRGSAHVELSGNGLLKVKDCGGDLEITVTGEGRHVVRRTERCIVHKYIGFNGFVVITGRHTAVKARGTNLYLAAQGKGTVLLQGIGTYMVGDESGTWRERGVEVFLPE